MRQGPAVLRIQPPDITQWTAMVRYVTASQWGGVNWDCCHYHTVPAPVVVSWSPEGVACVGNPVEMSSGLDYSSLEVLWPETPYTPHQLCYCPPFEGDQHLFSRCINTSSCDTHYSVTVNSDSVCFAGLQHELTSIPVYFTLLQPCGGGRCIIRSLLAQYIIMSRKY